MNKEEKELIKSVVEKGIRELTKAEKDAIEYQKFKNKVARLTPYAHDKRIFSRMEAQRLKDEQAKKPVSKMKKEKSNE